MGQKIVYSIVGTFPNSSLNPIWGEDFKIVREKEQGEQFYRNKLEGKVAFVGRDFSRLAEYPLDTRFKMSIQYTEDLATTSWISCYFDKADLEFDYSNGIAKTSLKIEDQYSPILDHIEDEIDVLSLGLPAKTLSITTRTILQLYVLGDQKITNVVGNQSYEVEAIDGAESYSESQIIAKKFSKVQSFVEVVVHFFNQEYGYLDGKYSGLDGKYLYRSDGAYYLADKGFWTNGDLAIYKSDGTRVRPDSQSDFRFEVLTLLPSFSTNNIYYESQDISDVVGQSESMAYTLFARLLRASATSYREESYRFTNFVPQNYRYVWAPPSNIITALRSGYRVSDKVQSDPTRWGKSSSGDYFVRPKSTALNPVSIIPVGWIRWDTYSFWLEIPENLDNLLQPSDLVWDIRHTYGIRNTLRALLNHFGISISTKSYFLSPDYEDSVKNLVPEFVPQSVYITPVTNLKKAFYDEAARSMKLSMRDILGVLRTCFNIYWDLDSDGSMRLEHISYFENGRSYLYDPPVSLNVDSIVQPRLLKSWSFGQNQKTYDLTGLPSRYEFNWASECTDIFEGFAIQMKNRYLEQNPKEILSTEKFISDVDLVMSTPDAFPDDAIVLLGTTDNREVSTQKLTGLLGITDMPSFFTQNGYLSFTFLELAYHRHSLGGTEAQAEDYPGSDTGQKSDIVVKSVKRFTKQNVSVPVHPSEILSLKGNIQTNGSTGSIEKITFTPDTNVAEIEILQ